MEKTWWKNSLITRNSSIHPFIHHVSCAIIFVSNISLCLHKIYFFCVIFSKKLSIESIFSEIYEDDIQCWCWDRERRFTIYQSLWRINSVRTIFIRFSLVFISVLFFNKSHLLFRKSTLPPSATTTTITTTARITSSKIDNKMLTLMFDVDGWSTQQNIIILEIEK